MTFHALEVVTLGELARVALERNGRVATALREFPDAPYYDAGDEILWVGTNLRAMHPRAVITTSVPSNGSRLYFTTVPAIGWRPNLCVPHCTEEAIDSINRLHELLAELPARGFGVLHSGGQLSFPLNLAGARVHTLARAYTNDDPEAVLAASTALLGLGNGLTPSGDDLVGAALFSRRWLVRGDSRWSNVQRALTERIRSRTHGIGAALFCDLIAGQSFAPLHELASALSKGNLSDARRAMSTLIEIGHSSGWDMLTGFLIGVLGEGFAAHDSNDRLRFA